MKNFAEKLKGFFGGITLTSVIGIFHVMGNLNTVEVSILPNDQNGISKTLERTNIPDLTMSARALVRNTGENEIRNVKFIARNGKGDKVLTNDPGTIAAKAAAVQTRTFDTKIGLEQSAEGRKGHTQWSTDVCYSDFLFLKHHAKGLHHSEVWGPTVQTTSSNFESSYRLWWQEEFPECKD